MNCWVKFPIKSCGGWRSCWPAKETPSCSARRSSNCAIGCMPWEPGLWRRSPRSDKKRDGYEGASLVCPHCQADARCVAVRAKRIDSLLGVVRIKRHYYHYGVCRQGCFPRDRRLGLGAAHLTPAASEVASLAGV